jgi:hypothetical protein
MSRLRAIVGVIVFFGVVAGTAESSPPLYREGFRGDPWIQWGYPDGDSVGQDCFSNCGAGCGDAFNPCGGRQQYWVQEMLDEPQFSHTEVSSSCDTFTGTQYYYTVQVHTAPMHETYYGFKTLACQMHDSTCGGGWAFIGCLWPPNAFCPFEREDREWSWVATRYGRKYEVSEVIERGCPCIGDQICP